MDETIAKAAQQEQTTPTETVTQDAPTEEVTLEAACAPAEEAAPVEAEALAEDAAPEGANASQKKHKGFRLTKKTAIILGAVLLVAIIAAIAMIPSKFERVESKCIQIAGQGGTGKNYFTLDTCPDFYENMDETMRNILLPGVQERTLEAIRYANDELDFPGVYSLMLNTTALMDRQSEENSKYKVSWSYHPDRGLEVMYKKK